jgi:hypothetical protein
LGLEHSWAERESGWKSGMDANLLKADAVVQLAVKDKDLTSPPGSPASGDRYIVGASATGAWAGKDKNVAVYISGAWTFYVPKDGWVAYVVDEGKFYVYASSAWSAYKPGTPTGTSKFVLFPAALFGSATVSNADPYSDEGFYDYIAMAAASDTKVATYFVAPEDYGATGSWKLLFAMASPGTDTTNLGVTMGINELNAGGTEEVADPCVISTGSFAVPGAAHRYAEGTFSTPSITITPGKLYKLYFHRKNAEDANNDELRFIGLKWTYTAA